MASRKHHLQLLEERLGVFWEVLNTIPDPLNPEKVWDWETNLRNTDRKNYEQILVATGKLNALQANSCSVHLECYFDRLKRKRQDEEDVGRDALPWNDSSILSEGGPPDKDVRTSVELVELLDQEIATIGKSEEERVMPTNLINDTELDRGSKSVFLSHVRNLVESAKGDFIDKARCPLGCTVCGSGGGKTTLLWLIATAWKKDVEEALGVATCNVAFATFNNACNITEDEKNIFQAPSARLGARLLASYRGCSMKYIREMLTTSSNKKFGRITLKRFLEKVRPTKTDAATLILIDEFLNIGASDSELGDLLYFLSTFQQQELMEGRKVVVVVTSLSSTPMSFLPLKSHRPLAPIPLPLLSADQVLREAWRFVNTIKKIRPLAHMDQETQHHLVCQFCATGGHMKSIAMMIEQFRKPDFPLRGIPFGLPRGNFSWATRILQASLFGEELPCSASVSPNDETTVQDLIDNHRVSVARSTIAGNGELVVAVHVIVLELRSIPERASSLSAQQSPTLGAIMAALSVPSVDYAKRFEEAIAHIISLRLSMGSATLTVGQLLPNGLGPGFDAIKDINITPIDKAVQRVPKLTKELLKKKAHGDIVLSECPIEKAVEGYIVLDLGGKLKVLFLQMKFWNTCAPGKIQTWEQSINRRAKELGLKPDQFYAAFFSTSENFSTSLKNSCAWPLSSIQHLFTPFGMGPMMLYTKERLESGGRTGTITGT